MAGSATCGWKKGAWCHAALVAHPGCCILELSGGQRRGEVGFGRFLRNPAVTMAALSAAAAQRTAARVAGRDILDIQDTSEIVLGGGQVDAALVELGGNDALRGLDPAAMQRNLMYILNTLAARHIPVLVSGMIAPPSLGTAYGREFSAVFAAMGRRPGVIYDPFFLAGLTGKPALVQADGIHPNAAGAAVDRRGAAARGDTGGKRWIVWLQTYYHT
ncbi:MAG: GDSL-type esterase/lipase family protein [Acidocella sp.]|nr:GDSL-type esterase/lipase family protein [Acidocella sp.]